MKVGWFPFFSKASIYDAKSYISLCIFIYLPNEIPSIVDCDFLKVSNVNNFIRFIFVFNNIGISLFYI